MAFTLEQIESLHNAGLMSDWAYYQQNGKSLQENYIEIERKLHEKLRMEAEIQRRVNAALAQQESEEYTVNIKTNVRVKK